MTKITKTTIIALIVLLSWSLIYLAVSQKHLETLAKENMQLKQDAKPSQLELLETKLQENRKERQNLEDQKGKVYEEARKQLDILEEQKEAKRQEAEAIKKDILNLLGL